MKKMTFLFLGCFLILTINAQQKIYPNNFVVAQDGSGQFTTIQAAIFAVRDLSQQKVTIHIKKGIYKEKIVVPSWKTNIELIGESKDSTIITWDDFAGKILAVRDQFLKTDSIRTFTSYTVLIQGNDCSIQNLTIKNTAGRVGQSVALHVEGDRFLMVRCNLLSNQDTLYAATSNSRQYYKDCFIEGTTDFIFGEATAVFQSCTIKSLINSFITAASTREEQLYGCVFFDCKLVADTAAKKVYLGRPWRPHAKTIFIRTEMGAHILNDGWQNWSNSANEKSVTYAEYKSYGAGASNKRVNWSKQLSTKEMKKYTLKNIFKNSSDWVIE